ncbi:hypothetical protein GCM10027037_12550 [Mucilaginibacter koreensis]
MKRRILDIDLDFFLDNVHYGTVTSEKRLSDSEFKPWSVEKVIAFQEQQCGLKKSQPIKGKIFKHHVEVFYFLRELQEENDFSYQFDIDHVDAHADLGTGDASYRYIATDLLQKPVRERCYPEKINGWEGLSSGNYLSFAIACRWLLSLTYINEGDPGDCQIFNLRNYANPNEGIELRQFSEAQMADVLNRADMHEYSRTIRPIATEPLVPFTILDRSNFQSDGKYDYILLALSPGFTPAAADELIPVIQQYMQLY